MKKYIMVMLAFVSHLLGCSQGYQSMTVPQFQTLISDAAVQIVDVRTPEEYKEKHIDKAVNMDIKNAGFSAEMERLDKSRPVAVYCRTGKRSKTAAEKLKEAGFKVFELDKGIEEWIKEGQPVVP